MPTVFSSSSKSLGSVSADSFTLDAGTDPDRVLLVMVMHGKTGAATTHTTPTYGGQNLTSLTGIQYADANSRRGLELFKLEDPPTGSNTLAYGTAVSVAVLSAMAVVLHAADVVNFVLADNYAEGSGTTPAVSITPAAATSRLVGFFFGTSGSMDPWAPDAAWTEHVDSQADAPANHAYTLTSKDAAGTSSETAGTTATATGDWGAAVAEVTVAGEAPVAKSGTDAATTSDVSSLAAASTVVDSAAAAEALALAASASAIDAAALAESAALARASAVTDTAAVAEAASLEQVYSVVDAGTLGESAVVELGPSATDAAAVADAVTSLAATGAASDAATVTETAVVAQASALSDVAALAESAFVEVTIAAADALTVAEAVLAAVDLEAGDAAALAEMVQLSISGPWWTPDPVAHTRAPVAYTAAPVGYTPKT